MVPNFDNSYLLEAFKNLSNGYFCYARCNSNPNCKLVAIDKYKNCKIYKIHASQYLTPEVGSKMSIKDNKT